MALTDPTLGNGNRLNIVSLTLTPATVAPATTAEQTFTMTNLAVGDFVDVINSGSSVGTLGIVNSRCSAAGVLAITWVNSSATTTATPTSGTYLVLVVHSFQQPTQTTL